MSENYLGYIIWHSLDSDAQFDLDFLHQLAEEMDIDVTLPNYISKTNCFKRGCKKAVIKEVNGDAKAKLYVENVRETNEIIERRILSTVVNKKLGLNKTTDVGSLVFEKKDSILSSMCTLPSGKKIIEIVENELDQGKYIDHIAMRNVVRTFIENNLNGIWLRTGTYFIEKDKKEEAEKFVAFNEQTLSSDAHILPLVNEDSQKMMLFKAFSSLTVEYFNEFMSMISSLDEQEKQPTATELSNLEKKKNEIIKSEDRILSILNIEHSALANTASETHKVYLKNLKEKYG